MTIPDGSERQKLREQEQELMTDELMSRSEVAYKIIRLEPMTLLARSSSRMRKGRWRFCGGVPSGRIDRTQLRAGVERWGAVGET